MFVSSLKLLEEAGIEAVMGGDNMADREAPPTAPEEKKPSLTVEELEAKQGSANKTEAIKINVDLCNQSSVTGS